MIFAFQPDPLSISLLGGAISATAALIPIYLSPIARVSRAVKRCVADDEAEPVATRPASIIVYADDDVEALENLLPRLLSQQYGAPYEVIVVNDGASEKIAMAVDMLRVSHPNLYMTFTPGDTRTVSRKKLALMLGIKAARYPVVVNTVSSARIDSDLWLARMMKPFADDNIQVAIGHGLHDPQADTSFGHRRRAFSHAADAVTWLSAALAHNPYRGTELNLAYTRDAFFANRGFSNSVRYTYGDDDLFVNEIARPDNTAVVLHPEAHVVRNVRDARSAYRHDRDRYSFTGTMLPRCSRRRMAAGAWLMWLTAGLCIAGAVVALPNLFYSAIALVILLGMVVAVTLTWRNALTALGSRRMLFVLPRLAMTRPIAKVFGAILSRRRRRRNYTWMD